VAKPKNHQEQKWAMKETEKQRRSTSTTSLRRQKDQARKAPNALTLPPLKLLDINELFDMPTLRRLDIDGPINALPELPELQGCSTSKKKRE
jgi:hypothetical protein